MKDFEKISTRIIIYIVALPITLYLFFEFKVYALLGFGTRYAETPMELTEIMIKQPIVFIVMLLVVILILLLLGLVMSYVYDRFIARRKSGRNTLSE